MGAVTSTKTTSDSLPAEIKGGVKLVFAKILGYVMGAGAIGLYTPIIFNIVNTQSADGLSITSWVYSLLGFTAGLVYPVGNKFPVSSYIDGIACWAQSVIILFLTCFSQNKLKEFLIGITFYTIAILYLFKKKCPEQFLTSIQILSTVACNYALIPQIFLNWKLKSATYSVITAFLSTIGNLLKIFTVYQLTNDRLLVFGHVMGFISNSVLLMQILSFNNYF